MMPWREGNNNMKLKPYPKYKDSGIQWIGKIPEGWGVRKIKFVTQVYSGTDGKDEGNFPLYGANGIIGKCKRPTFKEEKVIIGRVGSSGEINYAEGHYCVSDNALVLNNTKKIISKHLFYALNIIDFSIDVTLNAQPLLTATNVKNKFLVFPPFSDQTAITNFLDKKTAKTNVLIEKDKKLIALLKEKRTAMINRAVTKGLDPNVKLKDSGIKWIGKIPEGWEVRKLKFKETVIMGQSPDSESYNYDNIGFPFLQGNADFSEFYPQPSTWCDNANKYTLKNAILLSVRAPIGALNIADQKYGIGRGLCAIRVKISNLKYIYYQLMTCIDYLNSIGTGSTYTAISTEDVMNLPMRYPPKPEQTAIANFLDRATAKIDKTIKLIEQKVNLLEEYKKSLIHYVVTGKVDVRGVET